MGQQDRAFSSKGFDSKHSAEGGEPSLPSLQDFLDKQLSQGQGQGGNFPSGQQSSFQPYQGPGGAGAALARGKTSVQRADRLSPLPGRRGSGSRDKNSSPSEAAFSKPEAHSNGFQHPRPPSTGATGPAGFKLRRNPSSHRRIIIKANDQAPGNQNSNQKRSLGMAENFKALEEINRNISQVNQAIQGGNIVNQKDSFFKESSDSQASSPPKRERKLVAPEGEEEDKQSSEPVDPSHPDFKMVEQLLKDHQKIEHIMVKRKEWLRELQDCFQHKSTSEFVESLCRQRDMFVACDVLEQLLMKGLDAEMEPQESDTFVQQLDLASMLLLTQRLIDPKFMIKSKYKRHKICCYSTLKVIILEVLRRPDISARSSIDAEFEALLQGSHGASSSKPDSSDSKQSAQILACFKQFLSTPMLFTPNSNSSQTQAEAKLIKQIQEAVNQASEKRI